MNPLPSVWAPALLALVAAVEWRFPARVRRGGLRHGAVNLGLALLGFLVTAAVLGGATAAATANPLPGSVFTRAALSGAGRLALALLLFDAWMYLWHRANHRLPLLWRFHRVHHTDPAMDVTTAVRFHPGEMLLSGLFRLPVIILLGLTATELAVYGLALNAVVMFHHGNVAFPERADRVARLLLVTPGMHRVHHSVEWSETNSNYGSVFPWWDRMFGSYRWRADRNAIVFGLKLFTAARWQTLAGLLRVPLPRTDAPAR